MVVEKRVVAEGGDSKPNVETKPTKTLEKPKVSYEYAQKGVIQVCSACGGQKSTDGSNKLVCTAGPDTYNDCPRR